MIARPLSPSDLGALSWARLLNGARLVQSRQPIFNVPPVVVAVLVALGVVHAVRVWLLSDDLDRVLVWTLAFVPARYEASALIDGLLPGGWGAEVWTFVTYALVHADLTHLGINAIWLLDTSAKNAQPVRLTEKDLNATSPRWAPDGATVYFLGKSGPG